MSQMLRHKETGELFVYTTHLAALDVMELVVEDPVKKVLGEVAPAATSDGVPVFTETVVAPAPSEVPAPVEAVPVEKPAKSASKTAPKPAAKSSARQSSGE